MKTKIKNTLITIATSLFVLLIVTTATYAIGTLTPSGTAGDDTQYSLNDIYTKLTTGATTTEDSGTMTVPGTVSASFRTLTEIYNAVPEWLEMSSTTSAFSAGYYEAGDLATVDTDLAAANIVTGTTIFGVAGSAPAGDPVLTWQTDPGLLLCWSSGQYESDNGCSIGNGWTAEGYGAVEYCENLDAEGSTDWRLPTIAEFTSITDYTTYNNATQVPGFTQDADYWSSTPYAEDADYAWNWNTYYGNAYDNDRSNQYSVRCVH
jgi:hypothetical protein